VLLPRRRSVEIKPAARRAFKRVTAEAVDGAMPSDEGAGTGAVPDESEVDLTLDLGDDAADDGKSGRREVRSSRS
jgi:hypothetical protein